MSGTQTAETSVAWGNTRAARRLRRCGMGGAVADAPGSKNSTPDSKFIVVAPVVTWMAAETRSRAAAPLRGPRVEALKGILM